MFSDLAKVFSRDFLVGFFLPASIFFAATTYLLLLFDPFPNSPVNGLLQQINSFWILPGILFLIWLLAILLVSANRVLVRLLEGYIVLDKTPLKRLQHWRFNRLMQKIQRVEQHYHQVDGEEKPKLRPTYRQLLFHWHSRYPARQEYLLATQLGNVIRAFETYSNETYGLDAVPVWPRILAVVPREYRETIADARAQFDFAINLFWLFFAVLVQYFVFAVITQTTPMLFIPITLVVAIWLSYEFAIRGAVGWGETVKAAFDLYRGDLLKKLGIQAPETREQEKEYWTSISRTFLYLEKLELPLLKADQENEFPRLNDDTSDDSE